MRNWTLGQLRMLAAVAEQGSMRGAAEQLGYTVGAISQQMTALQKETGQSLFIRDGRRLLLSDAGRILHRHILGVLAAESEASAALDGMGSGIDSAVRLGVFGSAALACAVPALGLLSRTDPQLRVELREVEPDHALAAILSGSVDAALGLEYSAVPVKTPAEITRRALVREDLLVVCAAGRPGAASRPAEARHWILPPAASAFGRAARSALETEDIVPETEHTVMDTALALALADQGTGATLATASMLALYPADRTILRLGSGAERTIVAMARPAMLRRASVERLMEALVEAAAPSSGLRSGVGEVLHHEPLKHL